MDRSAARFAASASACGSIPIADINARASAL
jgi:hypothetical protein